MESDDDRSARRAANRNHLPDTRERIAIDISLLKKQYIKLRERQRQATTLSNAPKQPKQPQPTSTPTTLLSNAKASNINQYLIGRNAIVSSKGKRIGPPAGAIPPARVVVPLSASSKYRDKRLRNATVATVDNASTSALLKLRADDNSNLARKTSMLTRKRSESSSYSEDSEKDSDDELDSRVRIDSSSSDTSLCDEEFSMGGGSSKSRAPSSASDDSERQSYVRLEDPEIDALKFPSTTPSETSDIQTTDIDNGNNEREHSTKLEPAADEKHGLGLLNLPNRCEITSTSQLSPIGDISNYLGASSIISPLKTPTSYLLNSYPLCELDAKSTTDDVAEPSETSKSSQLQKFRVSDEGVTNAYFERVNHVTNLNRDPSSELFDDAIINAPSGSKSMEFIRSQSPSDFSDSDNKFSDEVRSPSSTACKNNDLILKIIEENSRILDRIMMKNNTQGVVGSSEKMETGRINDHDIGFNSSKSESADSKSGDDEVSRADDNQEVDNAVQLAVDRTEVVTYPDIIISSDFVDTVIENEKTRETDEECISLNKFTGTTESDDHIFKYGDLSECISKYLTNSIEETGTKTQSSNRRLDLNEAPPSQETVQPETPSTLALLVTDHDNPDDLKNLLKQSFYEYSKSPSESLSIDSKLENDLETLLKMSAELLRDEFPVKVASPEPFGTISPSQPPDTQPTDLSASIASDESSTAQSNRSSVFVDADALQLEMESVAGDISATISSIKNTIKSIDSLCQDDDRRSRERTDKTLNDIIRVVEKLDEEKESRSRSRERCADTSPYRALALSQEAKTEPRIDAQSNLDNPRYLASARMSRDRSRITSVGRRKDDDFGEYESRARRNKSPFSEEYRRELEATLAKQLGSNNTSPYKVGGKLELRHTTVTSTFYDRFLSQKYEEKYRMDRSPSSPIINKAYLNTLKPVPSTSFTDRQNRPTKSNETSPVNLAAIGTARPKSTYVQLPQFPMSAINRDTCTRSCDNILSDLNSAEATISTKLATARMKSANDTVDIDKMLQRHSAGVYYQSTSALPTKPKKPSELGIKLGLYKPS